MGKTRTMLGTLAAAIGIVGAGSAGADPVTVAGTATLTNLEARALGLPTTETPENIPVAFSIAFDTNGTADPFFANAGLFRVTGAGTGTAYVSAYENTTVTSGATRYSLDGYGIGNDLTLDLSLAAPLVYGGGAVAVLPGSTLSFGTFGNGGGVTYSGVVLAVSSALATPGAVPEPATWVTAMAGLGVAGVALRRRQARGRVRHA